MELVTVTALKSWLYCPRQVYFVEGLGLDPPQTSKMHEGLAAQAEVERVELRRTLERYGLWGRERVVNLRLSSERLGIVGNPDLVLVGEGKAAVVEFKLSGGVPGQAEWMQMACYSALVEDSLGLQADWMFGYRIPDDRVFREEYTEAWRVRISGVLEKVRRCVAGQLDPGPAEDGSRCSDCPYLNFCGDCW